MSSTTKNNTRKLPITPTSTKSNNPYNNNNHHHNHHHVNTTTATVSASSNNNNIDTLRSRSYSTHTFTSLDEVTQYNSADSTGHSFNDDPLGMHITDLLNAGVFQGIRKNNYFQHDNNDNYEEKEEQNTIFPLLSIRNLKKVQNFLLFSYYIIFNQQQQHTPTKIHKIKTLPTLSQSFKISIIFLLLSSIQISTFTNIILQNIILLYLVLLLFLSSLLVDYNDLYNTIFPLWVQHYVVNGVKDYVEQIGIDYFYTQRYLGRNQWIVNNNNDVDSQEEKHTNNDSNHNNNNEYQFLIHRNVPCAITKSKMKCTTTTNSTTNTTTTTTTTTAITTTAKNNNEHTPMWQCQNVNFDKLSSILQNQHNQNHNNQKYKLHPSSLDHLIATNYCYIMINGSNNNDNNKHSSKGNNNKQGSKRKLHSYRYTSRRKGLTITTTTNTTTNATATTNNYNDKDNNNIHIFHRHDKSDDNHLTPLSPILSSQSEDIGDWYDPKNGSSGVGPHTPSHQHHGGGNSGGGLTSVQSMDAIEIIRPSSIQRHDVVNHKMPSSPTSEKRPRRRLYAEKKNGDLIRRGSDGESDDDEDDETEAYQHVLDADVTLNPSEEVLLSDFEATNSDADVSFSSTSYADVDTNHSDRAFRKNKDESNNKDDVKWLDVGAKIGRRILESETLHQVITKSQMATNISSSFSGAEDESESKKKDPFDYTQAESPKNIAKPFHAMWTSPNVEYPSFDDAASEDYSISTETGEPSTQGDDKMTKTRSISRRNSMCSLSPKSKLSKRLAKPLRGYGHGRSISLPASPIRSRSVASRLSEANTSFSSSEAFQLVPRQFDANRFLPPSMAIHHNAAINNIDLIGKRDSRQTLDIKKLSLKNDVLPEFSNKFQPETPRVKARRRQPLLPGVRMVVPIYPASYRKKVSHSPCYYQFATVISSKRINASSPLFEEEDSDCLSITVLLDKSFLRSGKFAEMTLRILDTQRLMPRLDRNCLSFSCYSKITNSHLQPLSF